MQEIKHIKDYLISKFGYCSPAGYDDINPQLCMYVSLESSVSFKFKNPIYCICIKSKFRKYAWEWQKIEPSVGKCSIRQLFLQESSAVDVRRVLNTPVKHRSN